MNKLFLFLFALCFSPVRAQYAGFEPFPHYNKRLAEFDQEKPINAKTIVMLGDSMTELGLDWNGRLGATNIVNRGISSDTADGVALRLDKILAGRPKAIFLMIGINDLSHDLTAAEVAEMIKRLVDKIHHGAPQTKLYVQSCLPINEGFGRWQTLAGRSSDIPELNRLVSEYCESLGVEYINLYPRFLRHGTNQLRKELTRDGLHLSPAGYNIWGKELRPYIRKLIADDIGK
ncbi:MAG: GDSL-type esterase/lipase family protein [Prevotella sp.]|uniref:GDSL-type esterase/lipase family protein n=1 Tax=Prevotella sp. TaxID=59823 RepID=UPI002A2DD35D|nr:GDSL-type esterase/lipase family protein [Prevotella sp.]MDD7317977.1 GDSL-type esterase/lipase family protein [Prevotellaceae bacterium]MDY4020403.1 GDSL-type esterase/lipase family protein [Prevotella sp.]